MLAISFVAVACADSDPEVVIRTLDRATYEDKLLGSWQATMVANHAGLELQGIWLDEPGPPDGFELVVPDQFSTDDDTHVEWLDLHILETHGIDPSDAEIAEEWIDHLNNDIWVSTRRARDLMDDGVLPPRTGSAELNPDGVWSIDAQLETELFGLISPGLPDEARRRATRFARITNSGLAVDVSGFYAHLYAEAFIESDVSWLLDRALAAEPPDSEVTEIVETVRGWYFEFPDEWQLTRQRIRDRYDTDPEWWGSQVNFAATIMALLYGDGDVLETLEISALAGWDADNNMTAALGLLGVIVGHDGLPPSIANATDAYFNQDLTGQLPMFDSVTNISERTRRIGEAVMFERGARLRGEVYELPLGTDSVSSEEAPSE